MPTPPEDAYETTHPRAPLSGASLEHQPGTVLAGKYLLVRPLGAGGMGQVWVAQNLATGAEVAAKVLLPERAVVGEALERFRIEAQITASLSHRAIVRAFDLVELDPARGSLLLVMELLQGQSLGQRIEQAGRLSVAETVRVILPILSALDHAHRAGIVHRDLKPDNVFLATDPDGHVSPKLLDFGISKMRHASSAITARGALVGTPFYMSPEQARGEPVNGRSDLFGVGILLYECLTGSAPFGGQTLHEVVRSVLEMEPAPVYDAPEALRTVVARALAKSPDDRYATAAILADAIVDRGPLLCHRLRDDVGTPAVVEHDERATGRRADDDGAARRTFQSHAPRVGRGGRLSPRARGLAPRRARRLGAGAEPAARGAGADGDEAGGNRSRRARPARARRAGAPGAGDPDPGRAQSSSASEGGGARDGSHRRRTSSVARPRSWVLIRRARRQRPRLRASAPLLRVSCRHRPDL